MARDNVELNTIAARLLLDICPGLDADGTFSVVSDFQSIFF